MTCPDCAQRDNCDCHCAGCCACDCHDPEPLAPWEEGIIEFVNHLWETGHEVEEIVIRGTLPTPKREYVDILIHDFGTTRFRYEAT